MKNIISSLLVFTLISTVFISCNKEDDNNIKETPLLKDKPIISELEVGNGANHGETAEIYIGKDVHIAASILAKDRIAKIIIKIQDKKGVVVVAIKEYLDFKDQKNAYLHKHIDIPRNSKEGDYQFILKVIDQKGNSSEVLKEIKLVTNGLTHENIIIEGLGMKLGNTYTLSSGKDAHVSFKIDVEEEINSINIEISNDDIKIFEKEYTKSIYINKKKVKFHEHINIPMDIKKGNNKFIIRVLGKEKKLLAIKKQEIVIS